jgi:hypothetical protein
MVAFGKTPMGEAALVLRPRDAEGVLVLVPPAPGGRGKNKGPVQPSLSWHGKATGDTSDSPVMPATQVTAEQAVALVKEARTRSIGKQQAITVRGQWRGWLECRGPVDGPVVILERKIASYALLTVTSLPTGMGWQWTIARLEKWFTGEKAQSGESNTLSGAMGRAYQHIHSALGPACAFRDSHRRGAVDADYGALRPVRPAAEPRDPLAWMDEIDKPSTLRKPPQRRARKPTTKKAKPGPKASDVVNVAVLASDTELVKLVDATASTILEYGKKRTMKAAVAWVAAAWLAAGGTQGVTWRGKMTRKSRGTHTPGDVITVTAVGEGRLPHGSSSALAGNLTRLGGALADPDAGRLSVAIVFPSPPVERIDWDAAPMLKAMKATWTGLDATGQMHIESRGGSTIQRVAVLSFSSVQPGDAGLVVEYVIGPAPGAKVVGRAPAKYSLTRFTNTQHTRTEAPNTVGSKALVLEQIRRDLLDNRHLWRPFTMPASSKLPAKVVQSLVRHDLLAQLNDEALAKHARGGITADQVKEFRAARLARQIEDELDLFYPPVAEDRALLNRFMLTFRYTFAQARTLLKALNTPATVLRATDGETGGWRTKKHLMLVAKSMKLPRSSHAFWYRLDDTPTDQQLAMQEPANKASGNKPAAKPAPKKPAAKPAPKKPAANKTEPAAKPSSSADAAIASAVNQQMGLALGEFFGGASA